ncbi:MAG TPA: DUF6644 family protein [Bryobacteraceae bacterium]|nr:DUF6644 family protein [Bryobacteraceae bacterium]
MFFFSFSSYFSWMFPFFLWVDSTWLHNYIQGTTWVFPLVETIHILSLVVLLGSILLIDVRLLGIGIREWPPSQLANGLRSYIKWGLIAILVTGSLLFIAEPKKLYDNIGFGPKMVLLALAIIYQFTLFPKASSINKLTTPVWAKAAAVLSLVLWFGVGFCGRAIGFV